MPMRPIVPAQRATPAVSTTAGAERARHESTPLLSVHHYRVADVPVLRLSGDIDLATRDTAEAAIAVRQRGPALVLDLAEVDFVGACGITLLVRARRRAEDDGGRFHLACCGPVVRRGLEATGLLGTLRPFDSVAEAVAACSDVPSPRTGK